MVLWYYVVVKHARPRGPICLGAGYLACQDAVSCYFYFVLLTLVVVSVNGSVFLVCCVFVKCLAPINTAYEW